LLHKEDANQADYAIIHNTLQKKIQQTLKRSCCIFINCNAEPPDEETARGNIDKLFF
jgi:DNA-directed RNA polymerase subunit beta